MTVRVKVADLLGEGVSIAIRADGPTSSATGGRTFVTTQDTNPIVGRFDWKTFTIKMNGLRADAKTLYVFLVYLPDTTGTAYFDDVTLTHN